MSPLPTLPSRYGIAVGSVLLAFLVNRGICQSVHGEIPSFITFYPAVMLVALLLGPGPGLAATLLSALVVDCWIFSPAGQFGTTLRDLVSVGLFTAMGGLMCVVARRFRQRSLELRNRNAQLVQESRERQHAEMTLFQSEERYRSVVEDQTDLIARYRPDGTYTFVNMVFCRFFGKKFAEVVGKNWQPDVVAEDIARVEERLLLLSPEHPVAAIENRVISGCGEVRWMQFVNRGFFDERGNLVETQAVGRDITDRKLAELALAESQSLLNSIIESTSDMIWSVEPDTFGLCYFNSSLRDYFLEQRGIRLEPGLCPADLFPPGEYVQTWCNFYQRALEEGPFAVEYTVSSGRVILELNFNVLKLDGTVFGLSVFGADITKPKQAEANLKAYAQRLIIMEEELRKKIAHELHDDVGQEITALALNLVHLRNHLAVEAGAELLPVIEDSRMLAKSINRTVREMMMSLRPTQIDEYGLAPAVRHHAEQFAKRTGIAATVTVAPEFPRLATKTELALFRIIQEALNNIAKYSAASEVSLGLQGRGRSVQLSITDDGKGFDPQDARFQPTGSGWGLTIMRERAELAGCEFSLQSAPGEGTSITVSIREGC